MTSSFANSELANQNTLVVGISEAKLTTSISDIVITYALGSCLGVAIYDPIKKIGGILHCLLPLSNAAPDKARENPYMYVDTGTTKFLNDFFVLGGTRENMIVKIAGCAAMNNDNSHFQIGQRNHAVLRKILWKNNILIAAERVGGNDAKTLSLSMNDGTVLIKNASDCIKL